ncbi:MAG: hypothetical protein QOD39_331 [Mycobacterium sp.]|nr:hypothetical protein [Mycobacterium sp.]
MSPITSSPSKARVKRRGSWLEHYNTQRRHSALGGYPSAACYQPDNSVHVVADTLANRHVVSAGQLGPVEDPALPPSLGHRYHVGVIVKILAT